MKQLYTCILCVCILVSAKAQNVGIGASNPQQKLEVAGWIELGNESEGSSGTAGSIRYNTLGKIQFHNGTAWIDILSANNSGDYIQNQNTAAQTANYWISGSSSVGSVRFRELPANGTNYIALKSPDAVAANYTFTLPGVDGSDKQVLVTNGTGTLSWATTSTIIGTDADANDGLIVSYPDIDLNVRNGLNLSSDYIQLGGSLITPTTITQDNNTFTIANNNASNTVINLSGTGDFDVQDNGASALFVRDDGYVGIGTNAPGYPLNVTKQNTGGWQSRFTNNNSTVYLAHESGYGIHINTGAANSSSRYGLEVRNSSQTHFYVRDDGNVGVGTTAPGYKFTIAGGGGIFGVDNTASFLAKNSSGTYETYFWPRWSDNIMYMNFGSGGLNLRNNSSSTALFIDDDLSIDIKKGVLFNCDNCGGTSTIDGTSNWGDLTIQGRVLSSNSNLHLSPPGGYGVIINDDYRAAGGSSGTNFLDVDGYILAGDPSSPSAVSSSAWVAIYEQTFDDYYYWTQSNGCGKTYDWYYPFFTSSYIYHEQSNNDDDDYAYSPWIYIPTVVQASNIRLRWGMDVCTEKGYDGIRLQISINGGSWFIPSSGNYYSGNPNSNADNNCGGGPFAYAWSDADIGTIYDDPVYYAPYIDLDGAGIKPGDWVRFRFQASNDGSVFECPLYDDADIYEFILDAISETYSAGFNYGNIYAQGNIFAQSNQLLGDVAEYFPIEGYASPGDLVAMDPGKENAYVISDFAFNPYLIGVVSTKPSVLLNSPDSGEPVGLTGRVPVNVTDENGPIRVGDYLTSSSKRGYAMKADKAAYVIGRALEPLKEGNMKIICMIEPGWYNPSEGFSQSNGQFVIKSGEKKVIVNDQAMTRHSKVFITMLENPESSYWITGKEDGKFTLELAQAPSKNISFDYLIDNASVSQGMDMKESANNSGVAEFIEMDGKMVDKKDLNVKKKEHNGRPMHVATDAELAMVPPAVPHPEKAYIWAPGKELKEITSKK